MVRKLLIATLAAFVPAAAFAVYNANGGFIITGVLTYTETDSIYIQVSAPPAHSGCSNTFFVIPSTTLVDRRKILLARLLLAKATNEALNIGYDATGDCADGYIRVHRLG
jgi:hypothetical protein